MAAKAAKIAGELQARELLPDLLRAFDRLFEDPVQRDPQCWGENAIAKALTGLDYRESAPFLRGRAARADGAGLGRAGGYGHRLSAGSACWVLASCSDIRREEFLRCLVDRLTERRLHRPRGSGAGDRTDGGRRGRTAAAAEGPGGRRGAASDRAGVRLSAGRWKVIGAVDFSRRSWMQAPKTAQAEAALSLGTSRLPAAVAALEKAWEATRDPDLRLAIAARIERLAAGTRAGVSAGPS